MSSTHCTFCIAFVACMGSPLVYIEWPQCNGVECVNACTCRPLYVVSCMAPLPVTTHIHESANMAAGMRMPPPSPLPPHIQIIIKGKCAKNPITRRDLEWVSLGLASEVRFLIINCHQIFHQLYSVLTSTPCMMVSVSKSRRVI